eukprot:743308-Amphidinium_carterae.1
MKWHPAMWIPAGSNVDQETVPKLPASLKELAARGRVHHRERLSKGFEGIFGHHANSKEEVLRRRGPQIATEYEARLALHGELCPSVLHHQQDVAL